MGETQSSHRDNLSLELRRGALVLAVLTQLHREEYGYSLKKLLAEKGLDRSTPDYIRLSIGLEDLEDIKADTAQALQASQT